MGFWKRYIKEEGNYIVISHFPIVRLSAMLRKKYKTTKISNLFESIGMRIFGSGTVKIHKFYIPEILFIIENLL